MRSPGGARDSSGTNGTVTDESLNASLERATVLLAEARAGLIKAAAESDRLGLSELHQQLMLTITALDDVIATEQRECERRIADFRDDRDDRGVIGLDHWQELSATDRMKED